MESPMRLLKLVVKGAGLFVNDTFSMDFYAADRVSDREKPAYAHVHRLEKTSSIYSQNVVGISGINATGKSTALKVIQLALDLIDAPLLHAQRPLEATYAGKDAQGVELAGCLLAGRFVPSARIQDPRVQVGR
jgi:hypothetical protein